jgi:hypothetical protein
MPAPNSAAPEPDVHYLAYSKPAGEATVAGTVLSETPEALALELSRDISTT